MTVEPTKPPRFYRVRTLRKIFDCSDSTIRRMEQRGQIPKRIHLDGSKSVLWDADLIDRAAQKIKDGNKEGENIGVHT